MQISIIFYRLTDMFNMSKITLEQFQIFEINKTGNYRIVPEEDLKFLIKQAENSAKILQFEKKPLLGKIVKNYREEQGLRQSQLAEKASITNASMCNLENGVTKKPNLKTLKKLCSVLGPDFKKTLIDRGYLKSEKINL